MVKKMSIISYIQTCLPLENNVGTMLVFVVIFLSVYFFTRKPNGISPGSPLTLPFIGDLPLLVAGDILKTFQTLRERYGDIFSFYMGRKLFNVINGYELIHKSAVKRGWTFSGRPRETFPWEKVSEHQGIIRSKSHFWQRQRKFTHDQLKQFGFGKTSFESKILIDCRPDGHTLPSLGNFADIPYLKEQSFLHRIRHVCTL